MTNSRLQKKSNQVWRRRACLSCYSVYTTVETAEYSQSLAVTSKNGLLEPFARDKLFISIYNACGHRKRAVEDVNALTATIIVKLLPKSKNAAITTQEIAATANAVLKRFDKAASVYYAAYHGS